MSLRTRLDEDMKTALKNKDSLQLSVIRLLRSELKNAEIAKGASLTEDEIVQVVAREAKKRRESIEQFERGGRADLAEKEAAELKILSEYLPEQLGDDEIAGIAQEVISELHATSKADKGKVMAALMPRVRGRADGKLVNQIVDRLLERTSA
ncbi:MAG: GatB/YqeY domain-containing protein [Armatimonadetes bacterium]|nr:GatB/YqeY domain-containing protein [Armatimonadota bacterium]